MYFNDPYRTNDFNLYPAQKPESFHFFILENQYQDLERFFLWDLIALHGWKPTLASLALNIFKKEFYPKKKKLYSLR